VKGKFSVQFALVFRRAAALDTSKHSLLNLLSLLNVNDQILDLYQHTIFFGAGVSIRYFQIRRQTFGVLFWCRRNSKRISPWTDFQPLDWQNYAGHNSGVTAPLTKTLGDILCADKSKVRVSEDEWLKLLRAIAGGEQCALHSLYEQTHRIVFTLIVRITMNRETAEEVTLDVFYDVWRKASTYDPANGSVIGWIMNQARSRAIDRLRFDQRKKRVNTYPHSLGPTTDIVDPQQACLFEEQSRQLRDALNVLTTEERKAIETAFFSELTYEQTAGKLNQPLGTVKTRIRSGLGKLRDTLGLKVKATR
jgi:RNA polymerase sigma-70 factor (ECF subfamily)